MRLNLTTLQKNPPVLYQDDNICITVTQAKRQMYQAPWCFDSCALQQVQNVCIDLYAASKNMSKTGSVIIRDN